MGSILFTAKELFMARGLHRIYVGSGEKSGLFPKNGVGNLLAWAGFRPLKQFKQV